MKRYVQERRVQASFVKVNSAGGGRRPGWRSALATAAVVAFLVAFGGSASAFSYTPGTPATFCSGAGPAAGQCEELKGVAVDQSNGHVYVIDANGTTSPASNFRISEYDASGAFVKGFGVGVADGTAVPQVCTVTCVSGSPTGVGAIGTGARGIVVDPVTHIVYFVAGAAKVVYYNGTTGAFLGEFNGTSIGTDPTQQAPAAFAGTTGIALDTSGAQDYLYVGTSPGGVSVIDKFKVPDPSVPTLPAYVCQITGKEVASATECHVTASKDGAFDGISFSGQTGATLAADASGNVFIAEETGRNTVSMFDSTGAWVKALTATAPVAVSSGASGRLFVSDGNNASGGNKVQEFEVSTGSVISEFSLPGNSSLGLAVDTSSLASKGNVYVAEKAGKQLRKYIPQPTVTTTPEGAVTQTTAVLKGDVNNNGAGGGGVCSFQVALKADTTYTSPVATVPCDVSPVTGSANTPVTATVNTGIAANTEYIYRVRATNGNAEQVTGGDEGFKTVSNPPVVTTDPEGAVTQTTAVLKGHVDNEGAGPGSTCSFQVTLASDPTYASATTVPCTVTPVMGTANTEVTATATGLTAKTAYIYRVRATNEGGGPVNGVSEPFTTLVPPPVTTTAGATDITQTTAKVGGTVNPNGGAVSDCHIDYGTSASYGSTAPCSPTPGSGSSAENVSASLTGLTAGTTYHFRVVATNAGGTVPGSDQTFKTLDAPVVTPPPPPPSCVVPKLAGKKLGQAKSALSAAHCTLGKVTKPKAKKGKKLGPLVVKSSKPSAGAILPNGSKVDLKLGPKPKKKK